jgi:hypothetical protein
MLNIIAGDLKYWFAVVHWFWWDCGVHELKWSDVERVVSLGNSPSKFQPDKLRLAQRRTLDSSTGAMCERGPFQQCHALQISSENGDEIKDARSKFTFGTMLQLLSTSWLAGNAHACDYMTTWTGNGQLLLKYSCKNSEAAKKPWRRGEYIIARTTGNWITGDGWRRAYSRNELASAILPCR